jgi:hypothetical protein
MTDYEFLCFTLAKHPREPGLHRCTHFLQFCPPGTGYGGDRHQWLGKPSVEEILVGVTQTTNPAKIIGTKNKNFAYLQMQSEQCRGLWSRNTQILLHYRIGYGGGLHPRFGPWLRFAGLENSANV